MRMAGRFARRVKAWGQANQVPVIFCKKGERKHLVVEEYLASHPVAGPGVMSRDAAVGRLSQVCNRWIYTACLCFGLDLAEQARTGFGYNYSIYQVEYSRNPIFADGARMQHLVDTVVERTRTRLDVPLLRTLFGTKQRPRNLGRADLSPRL
jgi:hypothetical protein